MVQRWWYGLQWQTGKEAGGRGGGTQYFQDLTVYNIGASGGEGGGGGERTRVRFPRRPAVVLCHDSKSADAAAPSLKDNMSPQKTLNMYGDECDRIDRWEIQGHETAGFPKSATNRPAAWSCHGAKRNPRLRRSSMTHHTPAFFVPDDSGHDRLIHACTHTLVASRICMIDPTCTVIYYCNGRARQETRHLILP